jgi:hypothetical protein
VWESGVSVGAMVMYGLWGVAFSLVGAGWMLEAAAVGQYGIVSSALAAAMTVMRDNQRTRRMLARPDERVAPIRRN